MADTDVRVALGIAITAAEFEDLPLPKKVDFIRSDLLRQGLVVVPTEDIRMHLSIEHQGSDEWGAARRRLRAALPDTTDEEDHDG